MLLVPRKLKRGGGDLAVTRIRAPACWYLLAHNVDLVRAIVYSHSFLYNEYREGRGEMLA